MSRTELVKIVASWIFITAVFSLAWLYAPAIFGIIATAVALAAVLASRRTTRLCHIVKMIYAGQQRKETV